MVALFSEYAMATIFRQCETRFKREYYQHLVKYRNKCHLLFEYRPMKVFLGISRIKEYIIAESMNFFREESSSRRVLSALRPLTLASRIIASSIYCRLMSLR